MMHKSKENEANDKLPTFEKIMRDYGSFLVRNYRNELYKQIVGRVEKAFIEMVLERTEGNHLKASRILGINRNTLHSKIDKLGIKLNDFKV